MAGIIQSVFPGWSMLEIASVSEEVFDCALLFAAVFLVGLRSGG
jgi:hypothetical protein